jgi:hypothetical protein
MAGIRYTPLHPMGSIDDHVFIVTPHHLSLRPPPYQAGPQRHDQAKRDRYSKWVRERKTFLAGRMHHDHHALYAIFEEACLLFMEFSV